MEAVMRLKIAPFGAECSHKEFATSITESLFLSSNSSSMKDRKIDQYGFPSPIRSRSFLRSQTFNKCTSRAHTIKRSCSANFDESFSEHYIEGLAESFNLSHSEEDEDLSTEGSCSTSETNPSTTTNKDGVQIFSRNSFLQSQIEVLEPSMLGIQPERPVWLERESVIWASIERKAKSLDLPLSLKMIKKKHQRLKGLKVLGQSAYSSVGKAFSSMVFIIVELQSRALQIREALSNEDLETINDKVQREMHSSFAWLFQQVFSRTPALMIYVMILLANFSVYSTSHNLAVAQASQIDYSRMASKTFSENSTCGREANLVSEGTDDEDENSICSSKSMQYLSLSPEEVFQVGHQELSEAEVSLWNSILDEAIKMQASENYAVLDHDVLLRFVSPISVKIEPDYDYIEYLRTEVLYRMSENYAVLDHDVLPISVKMEPDYDYIEYLRTEVLYQMGLLRDPTNQLLLSNYAQFLQLVNHDYDSAEEYFKEAIQLEPPDAETLSRYADFLWRVRKDLWGAEERYLQALEVEPDNTHHAYKYASFLWDTGGEGTCFPLNAPINNE